MLIKTTMKRPRPRKTKALRTQLKQASLRDADLTREVMDDWAAVERDEMEEHIDRIAPMPEELKAMQATAKRTGANKLTMEDINAEIAAYRKQKQQGTHLPQVVKDVRAASKRKGLDKISREEIEAEVAATRSRKKALARRRGA
jgi:hypothetical protein